MTRPPVHYCPHCRCRPPADDFHPGTVNRAAPFYGLVLAVLAATQPTTTSNPEGNPEQ